MADGWVPDLTRTRGVTAWLAAGETAMIVLQRSDTNREEGTAEVLRRRYRLSPAETRMALAFDGTRALPAIAAELGITHETARTHLKHIFQKLGVSRQAELVASLMKLKGPS